MPFERRKPGDPIKHSATEVNAWNEVALSHRNDQQTIATPPETLLTWGMVLVRNDTDSDRARWDVLALDSPLFAADAAGYKVSPAFKGKTPDPENKPAHRSRICILAAPLKKDAIGRAFIGGQMAMNLEVLDLLHTRARVLDNYKLQSGFYGPVRILGAKATGESVLARVDIDSWDGGHCFAKVPAGSIASGTWSSPSLTTCDLAWPDPTTGAAVDVSAGRPHQIKVRHYGPAITYSAGKYIQCRILGGHIVPDVDYC